MTYVTQAIIADDPYMRARVSACAGQEGCADAAGIDPDQWSHQWRRVWAGAPGWDAAWESAAAGGRPDIGAQADVITDGMILTQIQEMKPFTNVEDHAPELIPRYQAVRDQIRLQFESYEERFRAILEQRDNPEG